jgi:hypothetical protein
MREEQVGEASAELEEIEIRLIRRDAGTQCRLKLDAPTVERYRQAWIDGARFPAVVLVYDGKHYFLADGFHRVESAYQANLKTVPADVRPGTRRDAVLLAVGANANHGLPRSNEDKRRAVDLLLRDPEWVKKSNGWLAKAAQVSKPFVSKRRDLLGAHADVVEGLDGKTHSVSEGEAVDEAEGSWDPWGGRVGAEAKAFLSEVDDWRLCELLAEKPVKGCKTQAESQYVKLRKISTSRLSDLIYMMEPGEEAGSAKEQPGWWWSAVLNRFDALLEMHTPVADVLAAIADVQSRPDLVRLCQRRLNADGDKDRQQRRLLLTWAGITNHYPWRYGTAQAELAEMVRAQFPAWAGNIDAQQQKAAEASAIDEDEDEVYLTSEKLDELWAALVAAENVEAANGLLADHDESVISLLWYRCLPRDVDQLEAQRVTAAIRPRLESPESCSDPVCSGRGGYSDGRNSYSTCWLCARNAQTVNNQKRIVLEHAADFARAGLEIPGLQLSEEVETLPPPAPVGCPICLQKDVGRQMTVDRGEVLEEHDLPFGEEGVCPGSFLPPAAAGQVMSDLDDCAPRLVWMLKHLSAAVGHPSFPWRDIEKLSPSVVTELRMWLAEGCPGTPQVKASATTAAADDAA